MEAAKATEAEDGSRSPLENAQRVFHSSHSDGGEKAHPNGLVHHAGRSIHMPVSSSPL